MLCLRGESLLRSGQPQLAVEAFETLLGEAPESPYAPQALFGRAAAREASGDEPGARSDRARLLSEHSGTPWAKRLAPSTP
jgi:TolA-binding protein